MDQYQDLDEATLQRMVSEATSYEERAALRQALRKRKKDKGEPVGRVKPRGNSVYNRFAGSTATKSSVHGGPNLVKPIPPSTKHQQENVASPAATPTPTEESPTKQHAATPIQQPVTPTPPNTPTPSDHSTEPAATPITTEPAEEITTEKLEEETEEKKVNDFGKDDNIIVGIKEEEEVTVSTDFTPDLDKLPQDSTDSVGHAPTPEPHADLHKYLVAYVNQELFLDPPLPVRGKALFDTCSDPTLLCKLINKSVAGTVDLRALSKVSGSATQRAEALQDNMTLVVESARAIGCRIHDATIDNILHKEPEAINDFLLDLVRARVVHMPGMEDEPSTTFTDLELLFQKLHISLDNEEESKSTSWRDDGDKVGKALREQSHPTQEGSWKDSKSDSTHLTYEQRAALRKAEREQRQKEKESEENSVGLTYEERAAKRKAEREQRRKEREALAK